MKPLPRTIPRASRKPRRRVVAALGVTLAVAAIAMTIAMPHPSLVPAFPYPYAASNVRRTLEAVVRIQTFDEHGCSLGGGSGVIIDDDVIATCLHVIDDATYIQALTVDGHEYPVRAVIDTLESADLALLRTRFISRGAARLHRWPLTAYDRVFALGYSQYAQDNFPDIGWGEIEAIRDDGWIEHTTWTAAGFSGGGVFADTGELLGLTVSTNVAGGYVAYSISVEHLEALLNRPRTAEAWQLAPADEWPYLTEFSHWASIYTMEELQVVVKALEEDFLSTDEATAYERIAADPQDLDAHRSLLLHFLKDGRLEQADVEVDIFNAMVPDDLFSRLIVAIGFTVNSNFEEAIEHLEAYRGEDAEVLPHYMLMMGFLYLEIEEPAKALLVYKELRELREDLAHELFIRVYPSVQDIVAEADSGLVDDGPAEEM